MATIQIKNEKKYAKAIGLLYEMGGLFHTKPFRQIVVGPFQLQVLRQAGLSSSEWSEETWQGKIVAYRAYGPSCEH